MSITASRKAKIEITASAAGVDSGVRDAQRKLRLLAREEAKAAKDAEKSAKKRRERVSGFAMGVGAAAGEKLFDAVGSGIGDVISFERALVRFQLAARQTPEQTNGMRTSINGIARETGLARDQVLAGAQAFVDLAGASAYTDDTMKAIARTAQATGSDVTSVATAAYTLSNSMKIAGPELESVFSGMVNQSKDGAAHFKDMAPELIALMPQFARFGVTGRQGAIELTAMFQVMKGGFKDSSETATGMSGIFKGLTLHADKFAKAGVQVYKVGKDGTKSFRPLTEIFEDIGKSSLMKDPTKLAKAFGRGEGLRAFQLLHEQIGRYNQLVDAGKDAGAVGRDLGTVLDSPAGKMDVALNNIKLAIAEVFTPERITAFANAVSSLADDLSGPLTQSLGKVADAAGFLFSIGQKVRGFMPGGDGHRSYSQEDKQQVWNQKLGVTAAGGHRTAEDEHRAQAAKRNMADVDQYNNALDRIVDAESKDGRSTPQSINAAMAAKYNTIDKTQGGIGAASAGASYLTNVGYKDPVEVVTKAVAANNAMLNKLLVDAIKTGFANANAIVVKVGADAVAKASHNAPSHRTGSKGR